MSAPTVCHMTLLGMDRVLFVGIIVSECWLRRLLNARNQIITVMGTVNRTVGHVPYEFNAYCGSKTTTPVSCPEYRQKNSV
jgi:hypothetical protein